MGTTCSYLFTPPSPAGVQSPSSDVALVVVPAIVCSVLVLAIVLAALTAGVGVAAISLCVHLKLKRKNTAPVGGTKDQSKCYC